MFPLLAAAVWMVAAVAAQPLYADLDDLDYVDLGPDLGPGSGLNFSSDFGARRPAVPIVEQSFQMMQDGANKWSFEAADGTGRWEEAAPAWTGAGVRGGYGYVGDNGPVAMSYVADKYGFQPTGNAVHPDIVAAVALQVAKAKAEPEGMWDENGFPLFEFSDY